MSNLTPYSNGRRMGSLLSWDPLRLFDELNRWEPAGSQTVWAPYVAPAQLKTSDDGATITIDMPGVDATDVDLTFADGKLTIVGKRGERVSRYAIDLGDAIDPDRIEAQLDKGVLTVHAQKKPEAKPRKIQVNTSLIKSLDTGDK